MITGWGVHHLDVAHWAMDRRNTRAPLLGSQLPVPKVVLGIVHGDFESNHKVRTTVNVIVSGKFPNGCCVLKCAEGIDLIVTRAKNR